MRADTTLKSKLQQRVLSLTFKAGPRPSFWMAKHQEGLQSLPLESNKASSVFPFTPSQSDFLNNFLNAFPIEEKSKNRKNHISFYLEFMLV